MVITVHLECHGWTNIKVTESQGAHGSQIYVFSAHLVFELRLTFPCTNSCR